MQENVLVLLNRAIVQLKEKESPGTTPGIAVALTGEHGNTYFPLYFGSCPTLSITMS